MAGRTYADLVRLSVTAGAVADPRAKKDPEDYVARRTVEWREAKETSYEHRPETGRWNLVKTHRTSTGLAIQFLFDISEQKRVEEELATKTALLELALENMGDGLALYDRDINIIIHNRQMREFFGFPEELLQGKATAERMARFLAIRGRYGGEIRECRSSACLSDSESAIGTPMSTLFLTVESSRCTTILCPTAH